MHVLCVIMMTHRTSGYRLWAAFPLLSVAAQQVNEGFLSEVVSSELVS